MAHYEGWSDSVAYPVVPVVDLHVCSADGCSFDVDEDFSGARVWHWPVFVDGAWAGFWFNDAVHLLFQLLFLYDLEGPLVWTVKPFTYLAFCGRD